ncbi:2801_t:CDS:2, partial [Acaulospora colombiana]
RVLLFVSYSTPSSTFDLLNFSIPTSLPSSIPTNGNECESKRSLCTRNTLITMKGPSRKLLLNLVEIFARVSKRAEAQQAEEFERGRPFKRRKMDVIMIDSSPERGGSHANPIEVDSSPRAPPQEENDIRSPPILVESSPDMAPTERPHPFKGKGREAKPNAPPIVEQDAGPSRTAKGKGRATQVPIPSVLPREAGSRSRGEAPDHPNWDRRRSLLIIHQQSTPGLRVLPARTPYIQSHGRIPRHVQSACHEEDPGGRGLDKRLDEAIAKLKQVEVAYAALNSKRVSDGRLIRTIVGKKSYNSPTAIGRDPHEYRTISKSVGLNVNVWMPLISISNSYGRTAESMAAAKAQNDRVAAWNIAKAKNDRKKEAHLYGSWERAILQARLPRTAKDLSDGVTNKCSVSVAVVQCNVCSHYDIRINGNTMDKCDWTDEYHHRIKGRSYLPDQFQKQKKPR